MCGIFGEFDYHGNLNLKQEIKKLDLIKHRGPDGFGYEYGDYNMGNYKLYHSYMPETLSHIELERMNYFIGHRRLSIIDLNQNASQPMEDFNKNYSITFNGEIYNYIEIRNELIASGCKFNTDHSDTEVLLNAYLTWGVKCLDKLTGMYAFAIFDKKKKEIFMARDRIGEKPLYYEMTDKKFIFSSEIMPLISFSDTKRNVNNEALCCYITYGYVPHPISIFENIYKLPPASYALVNLNRKEIYLNKYWDIDFNEEIIDNPINLIDEIEQIFTESVSLQLRSDVPVAAFTSGGTDSTLVVRKIREIKNDKFDVFGADFPNTDRSEKKYIEAVAERYNLSLNLSIINLEHTENINKIINVFDEPFDGGSSVAVFDLFKVASKNYKVILTGDGGDEIFAGYLHYNEYPKKKMVIDILKKLYLPSLFCSNMVKYGINNRKIIKIAKALKGDFLSNYLLLNHPMELVKLVKSSKDFEPDQIPMFNDIRDKIKWMSPVKALQYFDMNTGLPGRMLYKIDRFSMFHGVESRAPFLNHKIVEKAFKIPEELNIKDGKTKIILKKILEKDFNREFVYRKKMGFGNPFSNWFSNQETKYLFNLLNDKESIVFNYLDFDRLHKNFKQFKYGYDGTNERLLWRMIVIGQYFEKIKDLVN